ncbi:MAG: polysaccharide biosynthesis tyrosine autokinase [Chloroflexota bacterium]|nr:polysaccharide biosynthesis tyrosine autokinase [Chloroflexota bacterium]
MEIRQYLLILRKWFWLLLLGAVIGGGLGYFLSTRQPTIYQTRAKFMIISSPEERASNYYYTYNENQLAKSYSEMINTEQVLEILSERLGFRVSAGQIGVKTDPDSSIIEITVRDQNPERAALTANSLVDVFITYNETLQNSRYTSSEQSLQSQIDQVEEQINNLQIEMSQISQQTLVEQQQEVEANIAELESQIKPLDDEVEALLPTVFPPTPTPHMAILDKRVIVLTPVPTRTFTSAELARYKEAKDTYEEKQSQLDQLNSTLALYQQVSLNLSVYGESSLESSLNSSQSVRQSQLQSTLALYQQIYSNLLNSYESIRLSRLRSTASIVQTHKANVPSTPTQPQPVRDAALGAAIGVLLMGALVVLIEYLDDTIKTPEDINRILDLPVIALIGEMESVNKKDNNPGVYVSDNPRSPITESFRTLRSNLEFAGVDKPLRSLLISSSSPGEGKTTVAVNLAAIIAQSGKKVMLVDADLRRPCTHKFLSIPNRAGLSEIFRDPESTIADVKYEWGDPPFSIITSGALPHNPAELLGSEKMAQILDSLTKEYDIVLLDVPPFIVADAVVLSAKVDGVLLVIEPGKTKIDSGRAMLEQIEMSGARIVGVVLNPISRRRAQYYSGKFRYYSSHYYSRGYGYLATGSRRKKG